VQGYQAGGGGGGPRRNAAAGAGGPVSDVEAGAVVGKYMQQYEQSINPFAGGWLAAPRLAVVLTVFMVVRMLCCALLWWGKATTCRHARSPSTPLADGDCPQCCALLV